jgi:hypothetical protein
MSANGDPLASSLHTHDDRALQVKILAELRVISLLLQQGFGITDDVGSLRNEIMAQANRTDSDV